jgi:septum formation protein
MLKLVLASISPRRRELMQQFNLTCEIEPSEAEEIESQHFTASEISQINAYRKAIAVAKRFPDALVIGADTVVSQENTLYGKPRDRTDAKRMLRNLQGRTHEVVTGVCLIHRRANRQKLFAERTLVTFRPLTDEVIQQYLSIVNPLDKAGSYAIQEQGELLIQEISGSRTNVIGLPMERLQAELNKWPAPATAA